MLVVKKVFKAALVYFGVVILLCFLISFIEKVTHKAPVFYHMKEIYGVTVAYEEDEYGQIMVVRDLETEKLVRLQFVDEVTEEKYGDLSKVVAEKKYNVKLLIYHTEEVRYSGYVLDMAYVIEE